MPEIQNPFPVWWRAAIDRVRDREWRTKLVDLARRRPWVTITVAVVIFAAIAAVSFWASSQNDHRGHGVLPVSSHSTGMPHPAKPLATESGVPGGGAGPGKLGGPSKTTHSGNHNSHSNQLGQHTHYNPSKPTQTPSR